MRGLLGEVLSAQADITVVDMEAGLEHLSRSAGTLRYVDRRLANRAGFPLIEMAPDSALVQVVEGLADVLDVGSAPGL